MSMNIVSDAGSAETQPLKSLTASVEFAQLKLDASQVG
jgi:hypothetical protein